ncbi:MAG: hypothetical protein R3E66_13115 [bacterium]
MKYRGCLGFAGLGTLAISLLFVATTIGMMFDASRADGGAMFGLALFFAIFGVVGGLMTKKGFSKPKDKALDPRTIEQTVLGVARDLNGEVTVEELALATPLTVAEGKKILDGMVDHGAAEIGLGPNQETIYVFRGFLKGGKRTRSYDPFDEEVMFEDATAKATQDA